MAHYPRWVSTSPKINLREVAPNLYVGAIESPSQNRWPTVIDLCGSSSRNAEWYASSPVMLRWAFSDGEPLPNGLMETVLPLVKSRVKEGPVLIHCHAGLSRSVSVAYALLRRVWGLDHATALRRVKASPKFPVPATLASARAWVHGIRLEQAIAPVIGGLFSR